MSIASEINRIKSNIADAYTEAEAKDATMPATENSANLANTIASIPRHDEVLKFSLSPALTLIPDTWVQYTTGEEKAATESNAFSSTDYFEVCEGLKIRLVNFTKDDANSSGICFYDKNQAYISGVQYENQPSEMTFTVPAGAKYCRFTISKIKSEVFQCWFGGFPEAISAIAELPLPDNIAVIKQWNNSGFIELSENSLGTLPPIVTESPNYRCAFIDVSEYDYVILNGAGGETTAFLYAWITAKGEIIGKSDVSDIAINRLVQKPRMDIKYIVINDKDKSKNCYLGKRYVVPADHSDDWEVGLVSDYQGVKIAGAKIESNINARQKEPIYTGNINTLTVTPKKGVAIGARCFDASGIMNFVITKQTEPFTINCHANKYHYVWLFGSYATPTSNVDFSQDEKHIYNISNGYTVTSTNIKAMNLDLVNNVTVISNWVNGRFVNLGALSTAIPSMTTSQNFRYAITPAFEGDVVLLNCQGGKGSRAYAFLDENQRIIEMAPEEVSYHNTVLTAPHKTCYLVINDKEKKYDSYIVRNYDPETQKDNSLKFGLSIIRNNIKNFTTINTYKSQIELIYKSIAAARTANMIVFSWFSDLHQSNTFDGTGSISILNHLSHLCSADFILNSGDIAYDSNEYCIDYWEKQANVGNIPVILSIGNHDKDQSDICKYAGNLARLSTGSMGQENGLNYYFDLKGIRFINIDSGYNISNTTLEWITDVLSITTSKVVILTHKPCIAELNFGQQEITNGPALLNLLDNFTPGVIAYFHGHTHCDNIYVYNGEHNDIPFISIASGLPVSPAQNDQPTIGNPTTYTRTIGSISEYCMDIVSIDPTTGVIQTHRFGAGVDRTYTPETEDNSNES